MTQKITDTEKQNKDLLERQSIDNDRLNEQTKEINKYISSLRKEKTFKAIYYDPDYMTSWIENPGAVAEFFSKRGFEILNALQLERWVDERLEYNEAFHSILVFAQDVAPDSVADMCSDTCKLRIFLNSGGRVAWHGDVPFWYQGHSKNRRDIWEGKGSSLILNVGTILTDQALNGIMTEKGRMWRLTLPGPAKRLVPITDVDDIFTIGLPINHQTDTACAWRKIYNPKYPHSGFLRYWPGSRDGKNEFENADYYRLTTSNWDVPSEIDLPVIEPPRTQVFVSGNEYDMFRPDNTNIPFEKAAIEHRHKSWIQIPEAHWIWWRQWVTPEFQVGGVVQHVREFELADEPRKVTFVFAVDDRVSNLQFNGVHIGDNLGKLYNCTAIDFTQLAHKGNNRLSMVVINNKGPAPRHPDDNPTGLCYRIDVEY